VKERKEPVPSGESSARGKLRAVRSFVLGGVVGAAAAVVTRHHHHPPSKPSGGLAAFEDAPCYREASERNR